MVVTYADGWQRTFRGDDALTEDGHEARSALATAAGAAMLGSGAGIAARRPFQGGALFGLFPPKFVCVIFLPGILCC